MSFDIGGPIKCLESTTSRKRWWRSCVRWTCWCRRARAIADSIRSIGVTEVTYYRWRKEFGGLKVDQVKRLKELETENARLRKAVSDLTLDKLILQEAAWGNF